MQSLADEVRDLRQTHTRPHPHVSGQSWRQGVELRYARSAHVTRMPAPRTLRTLSARKTRRAGVGSLGMLFFKAVSYSLSSHLKKIKNIL